VIEHNPDTSEAPRQSRFVLHPYRSLGPRPFLILMMAMGIVSFIMGCVFVSIGAWPVMGFFGLDVTLVYWAFKLNYRSGRMVEVIDLDRELLKLTRIHPSGRQEAFEFNPYWARVKLLGQGTGRRTSLRLAAQGREVAFGAFLTDDERHEVADALTGALLISRGGARI